MTLKVSEWDKLPLIDIVCQISTAISCDFPAERVKRELSELIDAACCYVLDARYLSEQVKLERLLDLFYYQWGFRCADGVYCLSDAIWLDKVLSSRKGTPATLGILLATIADGIGLKLKPVVFPTQLLLRLENGSDSQWGINPSNGEVLSLEALRLWFEGYYGFGAKFNRKDFLKAENSQVVYNILNVWKNAFMHEAKPEFALTASQLMLDINPDDPYIIRDRGLIYVQLECNHLALHDLHEFIQRCPDDPVADVVKIQMDSLKDNRVILH